MNKYLVYLTVVALSLMGTSHVIAQEKSHDDCGGTATIQVTGMETMNEANLQRQIDSVQHQLEQISGFTTRKILEKNHLSAYLMQMRKAMTQLHDQMYEGGCLGARHGASLETRVDMLERHLNIE